MLSNVSDEFCQMNRDDDDPWNFKPLRRRRTKFPHSSSSSETCPNSQNKKETKNNTEAVVCLNLKPEKTSSGIKKEKGPVKIKTERLAVTKIESSHVSDDEFECIFVHSKQSNSFSTPVKKTTNPSHTFNNSHIKNQKNLKSIKTSSCKPKSTSKVKKKSPRGLSSLSWSTQPTLSFANQKLIITPPKFTGYKTSKLITPTKPLSKSPICSSLTKTLSHLHCDSLSPHIVRKTLNTSSKLLNALNSHENLTSQGEKKHVCSTRAIDTSLSLGNVSNSLKRKEFEEPSKRQLFFLDDSDYSPKPSSSAILDLAKSHQGLFTPADHKLSKSVSSAQSLSDTESYEDCDFVSPMSVSVSPCSSTSTIAFDDLSLSSYISPVKDVDKNLPLSDSAMKFETPTRSLKINEFSSLKDSYKIVSQTIPVCNKTPIKKKVLSSQKRVTSKKKANICSPTKSSTLRQNNLKNSFKNVQCNQTSLTSFFQSNNISSKEIVNTMSIPIQTTCPSTVSSSLVNESLLSNNTTNNKSLTCSPKAAAPKTVLSLDQFKQLFHNPATKQKTVTTESSIPTLSVSPIIENYKERKSYFTVCPFYKKIPGTSITVDAFKYGVIQGCRAYFLTHFHYDHYQGLSKHFSQTLYCSEVTANLVKLKIGVSNQYIHPLPLYCPVVIESIEVTLMDANHCPGSVIILFKYSDQDGKKAVLHTGDFRADSLMEEYNALKNVKINQLYLDTTYCYPKYMFPGQQEVLDFCVSLVKSFLKENPQTLVVVGTYTIGKEKVFLALAEAIGSKIGVTQEKKRLLDCLQSLTMDKLLTLDLKSCSIHVVKMNNLNYRDLKQHLARYGKFNQLLALKPTGWTHTNNTASLSDIKPSLKNDKITIYGVPYSEHSSFSEMKRFVQFIRPDNIVPTVNNGKAESRKFMQDTFNSWLSE